MLTEQRCRAPPMGRALRILLGLVLLVYAAPVYLRLSLRVVIESLLLMLALIAVYAVILVVSPRFIKPMLGHIIALGLLVALYIAGSCRLPILGGGKGQLAAVTFLGVSL